MSLSTSSAEMPAISSAARAALEMAGISALDVDKIIVATVTPDRILPSASCTLQERLGATHAAAFDLNAACSGFVYGVSVGAGLIAACVAPKRSCSVHE